MNYGDELEDEEETKDVDLEEAENGWMMEVKKSPHSSDASPLNAPTFFSTLLLFILSLRDLVVN